MEENTLFIIRLPYALNVIISKLNLPYSNIKVCELIESYIETGKAIFNNVNNDNGEYEKIINVLLTITSDAAVINEIINSSKYIVSDLFNELLIYGHHNKIIYVTDVTKRQIICTSYNFIHSADNRGSVDLLN